VTTNLSYVDRTKYPELDRYSRQDIWRDLGPGGLYLVSRLARYLELEPDAWVLDLGCGAAESSLYLAAHHQARVVAADLWTDPADNARKIAARGYRDRVIPLRLNASKPFPFADDYFDAILVMNNLNFYGTDLAVIDRIAGHLKPGGVFCSGGECLNCEFTPEQIAHPPDVYAFAEEVWQADFVTSHSPPWWAEHISRSSLLEVESCRELEDGRRFYEEQARVSEPEGYFGMSPQEARALEIRQIEWGREHRPYMTVYELVARRVGECGNQGLGNWGLGNWGLGMPSLSTLNSVIRNPWSPYN
jgi:cyclopropane fatty-acyl-phospholipid synthase-like methyltransferase